MNQNAVEACTSYMTCGLAMQVQDINWATIGAVILLIARLVKDVPDAYDAVMKRLEERKKKRKEKNDE